MLEQVLTLIVPSGVGSRFHLVLSLVFVDVRGCPVLSARFSRRRTTCSSCVPHVVPGVSCRRSALRVAVVTHAPGACES